PSPTPIPCSRRPAPVPRCASACSAATPPGTVRGPWSPRTEPSTPPSPNPTTATAAGRAASAAATSTPSPTATPSPPAAGPDPRAWTEAVEESLGTPVLLTSHGPRSTDKRPTAPQAALARQLSPWQIPPWQRGRTAGGIHEQRRPEPRPPLGAGPATRRRE